MGILYCEIEILNASWIGTYCWCFERCFERFDCQHSTDCKSHEQKLQLYSPSPELSIIGPSIAPSGRPKLLRECDERRINNEVSVFGTCSGAIKKLFGLEVSAKTVLRVLNFEVQQHFSDER